MSRYIDADKLLKRYKATCEIVCQYSTKQRKTMCSACGVGSCIEILEDFQTADVVEVVRCKDCKFHEDEQIGVVYCRVVVGGWVVDNWFCKDGERRYEK